MSEDGVRSARELVALCGSAYSRMACIAAGITGQHGTAEDIVQQAIAIAIEKNPGFESSERFNAWLAGVVRNCALNFRRKKGRRKTHSTDPVNLSEIQGKSDEEGPVDRSSGELLPFQNAFDDRVTVALQQLSPTARSCLLLRTVEQLDYREISSLMEIPEGTAMNLVHRSKKTLRGLLAPYSDRLDTSPQSGKVNDD